LNALNRDHRTFSPFSLELRCRQLSATAECSRCRAGSVLRVGTA
jgi:hypothetical protein